MAKVNKGRVARYIVDYDGRVEKVEVEFNAAGTRAYYEQRKTGRYSYGYETISCDAAALATTVAEAQERSTQTYKVWSLSTGWKHEHDVAVGFVTMRRGQLQYTAEGSTYTNRTNGEQLYFREADAIAASLVKQTEAVVSLKKQLADVQSKVKRLNARKRALGRDGKPTVGDKVDVSKWVVDAEATRKAAEKAAQKLAGGSK